MPKARPLEKKHLPCLGCGRTIWTDAAHRFCRRCRRRNRDVPDVATYRLLDARHGSDDLVV